MILRTNKSTRVNQNGEESNLEAESVKIPANLDGEDKLPSGTQEIEASLTEKKEKASADVERILSNHLNKKLSFDF